MKGIGEDELAREGIGLEAAESRQRHLDGVEAVAGADGLSAFLVELIGDADARLHEVIFAADAAGGAAGIAGVDEAFWRVGKDAGLLAGAIAADLVVLRLVGDEGIVAQPVGGGQAIGDAVLILRVDAGQRAMVG